MPTTIDLDKYNRLKKFADDAKSEATKAEGAEEQQLSDLKARFQCSTLEEAEAMLAKLEPEVEQMAQLGKRLMEEFEQQVQELQS